MEQLKLAPDLCFLEQQCIVNGLRNQTWGIREFLFIPANSDDFNDLPAFIRVGISENRWTDNEIGFEWFKEIFVHQASELNCRATEQERADEQRQAADIELDQEHAGDDAAGDEELKLHCGTHGVCFSYPGLAIHVIYFVPRLENHTFVIHLCGRNSTLVVGK